MEQEKKKSPDSEDGARSIKAYETLAMFSIILGIIFLITKEHELYQDCILCSLLLESSVIEKKINLKSS